MNSPGETPITGVFNNNSLEWIWDECDNYSTIDLDWYDYKNSPDYNEYAEYDRDTDTYLIGFKETLDRNEAWYWFELGHGLMPDNNAEYSAIVSVASNTTQVVHSRWFIRSALCSPCYPGQADCETEGEFLAYSLPPEIVGTNDLELQKRIFCIPVIPDNLKDFWDNEKQQFIPFAWPGGTTIIYETKHNEFMCAACATIRICEFDLFDPIIGAILYYEGEPMPCSECNELLEADYNPEEND